MRDIPEYDLVTIIGNITDNQMKAVPLVTDRDKRYVLFELEMLDNTIRIFAKNGMPPQQPVKMPYEDWFHGVGAAQCPGDAGKAWRGIGNGGSGRFLSHDGRTSVRRGAQGGLLQRSTGARVTKFC